MHVFIRKPYARFHMCTCSKLCYIRFCINLCVLLLSMTLFVCHFVPPYEVSESIVSVPVTVLLFICLPLNSLIFHLYREIWLWQDDFVIFVISMTAIFAKLLRMICGYVTSFVKYLSISLTVSWKDMQFTS